MLRAPFVFFTLIVLMVLFFESQTFAQDFFGDPGKPGKQQTKLAFKQAAGRPDGFSIANPNTKQMDASVFLPILQTSDSTWALNSKAQNLHLDHVQSESNFQLVDDLYSYQFGASWSHLDSQNQVWGVQGSFGSASDKPFSGNDVSAFEFNISKKVDTSSQSSWIYFLNYSNNRTFWSGIPLPGFAYLFFDATRTSGGAIGAPFVSYWMRTASGGIFSGFLLFPSVVRLMVGQMLWGPLQGNLKLEYGQQAYLRSERANANERIFFESKKIAAGLKSFFGPHTHIELELARNIDRNLYDGKNTWAPTSDRLRLTDESMMSLAAQYSF